MKHILPPNIGFTIDKIPEDILKILKDRKEVMYEHYDEYSKHQHAVSGHIKNERLFKNVPEEIERYLIGLAIEHDKEYNYFATCNHLLPGYDLEIDDVWINFQEKHELNPVHCHFGVYSFVFWLEMPFTHDEEQSLLPEANNMRSGKFEFLYTNTLGQVNTYTINTDKFSEGYVCLFPSNYRHLVYPFNSSDGLRISIAGNLVATY
jgi:hypothetical protein